MLEGVCESNLRAEGMRKEEGTHLGMLMTVLVSLTRSRSLIAGRWPSGIPERASLRRRERRTRSGREIASIVATVLCCWADQA